MNIENLPWLERLSNDQYQNLAMRLKNVKEIDQDILSTIKAYHLNERLLTTIGKRSTADALEKINVPQSNRLRLGLIGNYSLDLLKFPLIASGLRHNCIFDVTMGVFNNLMQEALNPQSDINSKPLDAIVIFLDHHIFELTQNGVELDQATVVNNAIIFVKSLIEGFNQTRKVTCIIQSIVNLPFLTSPILSSVVDEFNTKLRTSLMHSSHYVFDMAMLAQVVGLENWHQPIQYYMAKLAFSQSLVPLIVDKLAKCIADLHQSPKKCIVVDLDNTMWGGVVGDLGASGVVVGQGQMLGEAFVAFQQILLSLKAKGFLLAVCSKNDEENAKEPFISRKEMILSLNDFVMFKANWEPKSQNILSIAKTLSIGLDSIIFIDDNIAEREEVRRALPDVTVLSVPEDAAYFPFVLLNSGFFNSREKTLEDESRTAMYIENAERETHKANFSDLKSFYESLKMKLTISPITEGNKARVVQLINKTNQFNLTQKRITHSDFEMLLQLPGQSVFCFDLNDKFGNNGIIGVVLIKEENDAFRIENFILSCRVIGREVEHAIINFLVQKAIDEKKRYLIGEFKPGVRNEIVANSYNTWGFNLKYESPSAETIWQLDVDKFSCLPHMIEVCIERDLLVSETI